MFPWGTTLINLTGSLVLGVVTGPVLFHALPRVLKLMVGTGFCGAYTTFSTFTYETAQLGGSGARLWAFGNVAGSVVAGLLAATAGIALAAAFLGPITPGSPPRRWVSAASPTAPARPSQ